MPRLAQLQMVAGVGNAYWPQTWKENIVRAACPLATALLICARTSPTQVGCAARGEAGRLKRAELKRAACP